MIVVVSFVDVWCEVVYFVVGVGEVGCFWIVRRYVDDVDDVFVYFVWCYVFLGFVVVVSDVYEVVVGIGLDEVFGDWVFCDDEEVVVVFGCDLFVGDWVVVFVLLVFVVVC